MHSAESFRRGRPDSVVSVPADMVRGLFRSFPTYPGAVGICSGCSGSCQAVSGRHGSGVLDMLQTVSGILCNAFRSDTAHIALFSTERAFSGVLLRYRSNVPRKAIPVLNRALDALNHKRVFSAGIW